MKLEDEQVEKLTPIEYLTVTSAVPELDQVQIMTMGDLTRDAATLLLDAGCSKCQLLKLYGIRTPGGPHYKLLARVLDGSQPGYSGKTVDAETEIIC